jgi:hypothetical protein
MKAKQSATATLTDVKLLLTAPVRLQTKRKAYREAEMAYVRARRAFTERATSTTWAVLVEKARQLHAEARRVQGASEDRARQATATLAAADEGGEA